MTKTEALHELKCYMHDLKAEARREGYKVDRTQTWEMMVEGWRDADAITDDTAAQWIAKGPR
jgi:hypothetical protein